MTERPEIPLSRPRIGEEERAAVDAVLRSGRLAQGPEVAAFEEELAAGLSGTRHAVAVSSGTAALELALAALDVGPGDEVITTPFTFAATVNAVLRAGATAVLVDVGDDFTVDPAAAAAAVTPRTKVVLPVHLFGLCADVEALGSCGVPILEDAAQAHLAALDERRAGSLGVAGCFSFYPTKNMTTGEGGAVTTDDGDVAERVRVLRNQGMRARYEYVAVGTNLRMTDVAAAVGRVQLHRLPAWTEARRRNAEFLGAALAGVPGVSTPACPPGRVHAWHQYTVLLDPALERSRVMDALARRGVGCGVYYPDVVADVGVYRDHPRVVTSGPLKRARDFAGRVLSLPVHPGLDDGDLHRIAETTREAVA